MVWEAKGDEVLADFDNWSFLFLLSRELALEFRDCLLPDDGGAHAGADAEYRSMADEQKITDVPGAGESSGVAECDVIDENDLITTKSIIVKADGAGSLTSIQDTVDEMPGISVW